MKKKIKDMTKEERNAYQRERYRVYRIKHGIGLKKPRLNLTEEEKKERRRELQKERYRKLHPKKIPLTEEERKQRRHDYFQKYYAEHKEKIQERNRADYKNRKDFYKQYNKDWQRKNKDKIKEYNRKNRANKVIIPPEDTQEEIWRDIAGFEGFYKISSLERIWSYKTGKFIKVHIVNGYNAVSLYKCGKSFTRYLNNLMKNTFDPKDDKIRELELTIKELEDKVNDLNKKLYG